MESNGTQDVGGARAAPTAVIEVPAPDRYTQMMGVRSTPPTKIHDTFWCQLGISWGCLSDPRWQTDCSWCSGNDVQNRKTDWTYIVFLPRDPFLPFWNPRARDSDLDKE